MKTKKSLWLPVSWGFYFFLVVVAVLVPALVAKDGSNKSTISLFDLFAIGSISFSSSSYSLGLNSFYSIITVLIFFVPFILYFVKKDVCKFVTLGFSLTLFAYTLNFIKGYSDIEDAYGAAVADKISAPGLIIIFIATIFAVIISCVDVFVTFYYEKMVANLNENRKQQSKVEMLEESKQILDKGLITQEEYDSRKSKILGE